MAGLVLANHVLLCTTNNTWMPGTRPGMTKEYTPGTPLMTIRFDGRVAIVTGAGNGLGRAHALGLASRGAKVVVNDFGGARDGTGGSLSPAETVGDEIRKAGGTPMAHRAHASKL